MVRAGRTGPHNRFIFKDKECVTGCVKDNSAGSVQRRRDERVENKTKREREAQILAKHGASGSWNFGTLSLSQTPMVFSANPLSLAVPDPVFETWLRDNHYLEILDDRTAAVAGPADRRTSRATAATGGRAADKASTLFTAASSLFSVGSTLVSVLTVNPFAKLVAEDFAGDTPSWTLSFLGFPGSFSWPASHSQARMRVHENVKRYARNYAFLSVLILACCLYQMPIALLGIISSLLLWEVFRIADNKWTLERFSILRQILLYLLQSAIAIVLYYCNVQISLFWALCISYTVMLLHALLRKLTPTKQSTRAENHRTMKIKCDYEQVEETRTKSRCLIVKRLVQILVTFFIGCNKISVLHRDLPSLERRKARSFFRSEEDLTGVAL
ncbi:hypothetical protein H6P81_009354 [Aristolochia fimbriata]|uniref:PRA1 family protein n=1 Tax=Aristolochia fimbriata TaxID=158543 RepID=A0AAV7EL62_ARIFI|nr:hypothetical protein H6P81_009354 [Aristolochia fimbriata]